MENREIKRTRKLRIWYPKAMYHVTSRGNRRNDKSYSPPNTNKRKTH